VPVVVGAVSEGFPTRLAATVLALGLALGATAVAAPPALGPEETVKRYLGDLQKGNFDDAYDLVSKAMKRGKDREVWSKEQKAGMGFADVKIFDFQVQAATVEGDKARVPNVLSSQDRFINQLGLTEYELYTLVKEDGHWKVDQQLIVEPSEVGKWFPQARKPADGKGG
jgi:hypothetical protein